MATAAEYAQWIVKNKDKKGTPEFDKVSDAYKLARARSTSIDPTGEQSPASDIVRSFGSGVADIVGLPVDAVSAGRRALGNDPGVQAGGSENLRDMASMVRLAFPKGEEPTDFGSRFMREAGSAAVPLAGIMGRGASLAGRQATNAVDRLAQAAARRPGSTLAFEGASVAGAAAGGAIAQQYTDSPAIIALSELAGGLGPTAALAAPGAAMAVAKKTPVVGTAMKVAGKALPTALPFTTAGGRVIAGRRVQALTEDPERAAARLAGSDIIAGVNLSPARRVGESRLLALEDAILRTDPALDAQFSKNLAEANAQTRVVAQEFLGDPKRARKLLEVRREHLLSLLDTRAAQASREAQEAVERLGPDATERQISIAAREKVSAALADARETERALWKAIDRDVPAPLEGGRQALANATRDRTKAADPEDLPDYVTRLLAEKDGITAGYVSDLRSRLLDDAAAARAGGQRNKARILSDVADGLRVDLESTGDAARSAAAFSAQLNDKFTRGSVGELLGHGRDRGLRVDPSETLEFMDAGKDIGRANRLTELLDAAPDAAPDVQRYLSGAFVRQATDGGQINPRAAQRFIEKYGETLDQFPELKSGIEQAIKSSARAVSSQGRAARVTKALGNNRMSRASLYLDGAVGEEWRRVLNADDPVKESRALLSQVRRDKDAVQGLKQGFVDELLRRSQTSDVDEAGEIITSGKRFRLMLAQNKAVAGAILSPSELARLDKISNTFARIEMRPGDPVTVMDDKVSHALDFIASYLGAHAGGKAGKEMGSSLVMAGRTAAYFRRIGNGLTTNKARALITGAVDDPDLYRALLVGPTSSAAKQADSLRRINAWLAAPATQDQEQ